MGLNMDRRNEELLEFMEMQEAISRTHSGKTRFFDTRDFPWVEDIEACWADIRAETDRLLTAIDHLPGFEQIQTEQNDLTDDRRWKVFPFCAYGHWMSENDRRCPETSRILGHIPGMQAAMLSILQPGKELRPHRGPYNGVLRYHLGITIPKPEHQCGIVVGGELAHWFEGKSLIFDDSHLHSAWNRSNENRVVLFVDFERPLQPELGSRNVSILSKYGSSAFTKDAVGNWSAWESKYGSSLDAVLGI